MSQKSAIIVGAGPHGLTAVVDHLVHGLGSKEKIWVVNTEQEYREEA